MKMKLNERKYRTEKAIEQLIEIVDKLNRHTEEDIKDFKSSIEIPCKIWDSNGRLRGDYYFADWNYNLTKVIFKNGEFALEGYAPDDYNLEYEGKSKVYLTCEFDNIVHINFTKLVEGLEDAIHIYNEYCEKKDVEIEKFITLCDAYNGRN